LSRQIVPLREDRSTISYCLVIKHKEV
jgi:hypothetical protein